MSGSSSMTSRVVLRMELGKETCSTNGSDHAQIKILSRRARGRIKSSAAALARNPRDNRGGAEEAEHGGGRREERGETRGPLFLVLLLSSGLRVLRASAVAFFFSTGSGSGLRRGVLLVLQFFRLGLRRRSIGRRLLALA